MAHFKVSNHVLCWKMNIFLAYKCECLALNTIVHNIQPNVSKQKTHNVKIEKIDHKSGSNPQGTVLVPFCGLLKGQKSCVMSENKYFFGL